jgi:hypothetical protein
LSRGHPAYRTLDTISSERCRPSPSLSNSPIIIKIIIIKMFRQHSNIFLSRPSGAALSVLTVFLLRDL